MRLLAGLIILILLGCAMLAANSHKPFETRIDAQSPGVWPKYAADETARFNAMPQLLLSPCPLGPQNLPATGGPRPIVRT